jgi:hypothetical protein
VAVIQLFNENDFKERYGLYDSLLVFQHFSKNAEIEKVCQDNK